MIIYFYSIVPLLFLPTDTSSIRDRNFRNDLVPLFGSRLDSSKKDANSLKIVSNEPFIIQLQMPNSGESTRKGSKEKDEKRKRPLKKRVPKLKPLRKRHRQRRDLQFPKIDLDRERKSDRLERTGKVIDESENATKNAISRADILKALSSYTKKRVEKKGNKDVKNFQQDEEGGTETAKYISNKTPDVDIQRLSPSPLVKMVYPSAPKTDKQSHKYSYKDLMSDRERLEKKIKYIKNMMNLSTADDAVRVRRRSESDRTANKIAKMFLTLSAVNGLHDRLKSKCDDDDDDNDEDSYGFWEKESQENPLRRSSSSNEERYKMKKWIEHMKNKRSSSKTCPCVAKEHEEESDVFPLEQKLPKNYYLLQKGGGSEESSEAYGDLSHFHRDKPNRNNHNKKRNHKAREEQENKLKALAGKGRKLDLPLDDLDLYRMKAKQILQNAEEILDKIKEEEERRLSTPNILMNQLKELTSRIQTDPRNNENDLIRKIQKTLDLGPMSKSSDGTGGSGFLENVKSFILDPYEKAKALTDESTKKLSSYLLRNLGELQEADEVKEDGDDKGISDVYFGQVPQKKMEKPYPVSLAKENTPDDKQSKCKERPQNWTDTVSLLTGRNENKKTEDPSSDLEEQFKKRMEEIMKEQEKKLNGYEATQESEESSKEHDRIGNRKEEQGENEIVEQKNLKEDEIVTPIMQKKDEENYKTEKIDNSDSSLGSTSRESDSVSEKKVSEGAEENETTSAFKNEKAEQEVLEEILKEFDKSEESSESKVAPAYKELSYKGEEERSSANEESAPVKSVHEKSKEQDEIPEAVAAATPKGKETGLRKGSDVDPKGVTDYEGLTGGSDEISHYGTDERTAAKKPEQLKEDKSDEEPVLEEQKEIETELYPEINSADGLDKTPSLSADAKETVGVDDPALSSADELKKETIQTLNIQTEIEPQVAMEYPDPLKEVKPDESLEKMKSNDEEDEVGAERNEKEDTSQLENLDEVHMQEEGDSSKENAYDQTLGDLQLPKAVMNNEDQEGLSGATLDVENSNEGFDESKEEVSSHQEEENYTDESPSGSATSKEFIKEASTGPHSNEDGDDASHRIEKPAEEASAAYESEASLKEANGKVEGTPYSSEDTTSLKVTTNNQSDEKDADVNVDDRTLGMTATSEEVNEKLGNSESSNEAPLKSALNKSQDPDKYAEEISRMAADSSRGGYDEDGETHIVDKETDDKLKLAKSNFGVDDDLETLKEKDGTEVVSEEKEESFGRKSEEERGEEIRLAATSPTGEIGRETQNPDNDGINDTVQKEGTPDEKSGTEREDEDTLSRAPGSQDPENLKDEREEVFSEKPEGINTQDEKNMNLDATTDETLKVTLEEKDRENFDEVDKGEDSRQSEESDEKLKVVDKTKEIEAVLDDRTLEKGDINEDISLKATNNEEVDGLNENNDETPLQAPLDDKDQEAIRQIDETILKEANVDDDAREGDENGDDDNSMKNLSKNGQLLPKEADETLSTATFTDEVVNKEAEENRDKSEGISDDISLKIADNKDSEEFLEGAETPLKATRNKTEEETLEDIEETPLRTLNTDDGLNDKKTGNSKRSGEKGAYTDGVMEDDLTAGADDQTFVRAKSPEEATHKSSASDDENILRAPNFEGFNNDVHDSDEIPLRATDDLNHKESFKSPSKYDSEEYLREVSIPDDFNNQIDGQNEDESPLQSVKSFAGIQKESEEGFEILRKENLSDDPEEAENQAVSKEDESPLAAAASKSQIKSQKNPKEEITSEYLQELHPRGYPLKTNPLKVPTSIAKIMKDLDGQEKDDITTIENLNPEKIDYIIGKIDEVEQQNKVTDEVDCRRECACAEDINTKSRNIGRYEIVKDILQWMKDLQLNRVLSAD